MPEITDEDLEKTRAPWLNCEAESVPFYLRAAITQGELIKLMGRLKALEAENAEFRRGLSQFNASQALCPHVWKVLLGGRPFLVTSIEEPYFPLVYELARVRGIELGQWTPADQDQMAEALSEHSHQVK